jgi:hypothetical protein
MITTSAAHPGERRLQGSGAAHGDPDGVPPAPATAPGPHPNLFDRKTGLPQTTGEGRIGRN